MESYGNFTEGSAIKTTVDVIAGQTITFDYHWDSEEYTEGQFNDASFLIVGDEIIKIEDINSGFEGKSGKFSYVAKTSGSLLLGISVFDVVDTFATTTLTVDNINIISCC